MKLRLIAVLLLLSVGMSDAKIFDLGNYSLDTGYYIPPSDAIAHPTSGSINWQWSENESSFIDMTIFPEDVFQSIAKNYPSTQEAVLELAMMETSAMLLNWAGRELSPENLNAVRNISVGLYTDKPYPGWIVTFPNTLMKVYCGAVDECTYIAVITTESDEMFSLLLKGLRVIPKENASEERLIAIRNMIQ